MHAALPGRVWTSAAAAVAAGHHTRVICALGSLQSSSQVLQRIPGCFVRMFLLHHNQPLLSPHNLPSHTHIARLTTPNGCDDNAVLPAPRGADGAARPQLGERDKIDRARIRTGGASTASSRLEGGGDSWWCGDIDARAATLSDFTTEQSFMRMRKLHQRTTPHHSIPNDIMLVLVACSGES